MSAKTLSIAATVEFPGFTLEVDRTLELNGVTALFGPSGAGKSTLLNLIAGFHRPKTGRIAFEEEVWCDTENRLWSPPHKRPVGFLFQDARLFPHMTVHKNLFYAERRCDARRHAYRFEDIVEATGLSPLLERMPDALSGGERQRAALARTLLSRPDLLLFDEPLSALDRGAKAELLPFLETLPVKFGVPAIYVTHDIDEVSRVSDHVVFLDSGRIAGAGPTADMLSALGLDAGRNPFEATSLLVGRVEAHETETGLTRLKIGEDEIWLPMNKSLAVGGRASLRLSARDVAIALSRPQATSIQNMLTAQVTGTRQAAGSAFCDVELDVSGQALTARVTKKAAGSLALVKGLPVWALIKAASFQR